MIKGVITADIVGSTQIKEDERGALPKLIEQLAEEITAIAPLREYILLGTFLSFTMAVLVGLLARWGMTWL